MVKKLELQSIDFSKIELKPEILLDAENIRYEIYNFVKRNATLNRDDRSKIFDHHHSQLEYLLKFVIDSVDGNVHRDHQNFSVVPYVSNAESQVLCLKLNDFAAYFSREGDSWVYKETTWRTFDTGVEA